MSINESSEAGYVAPTRLSLAVINDFNFQLSEFSIDMKRSTKDTVYCYAKIASKGIDITGDITYYVSTGLFDFSLKRLLQQGNDFQFVFVGNGDEVIPYEHLVFYPHEQLLCEKIFGDKNKEFVPEWILEMFTIINSRASGS